MVRHLRLKTSTLVFGMILLSSLGRAAKASQFNTVFFTYGFVWGSIEFPEEAHPADTITCNLTISAYIDVNVYNFTLEISGLTGEKWQSLRTQIISQYIKQGENLTTSVTVTLPQNTSERLRYTVEASTDKGFGKGIFYATYVRATTYDQLSSLYDALLLNHTMLLADYDQLLTKYNTLNLTYSSLASEYYAIQARYNSLNFSYESLNASYSSLTSSYGTLQQDYAYLKGKYDASIGELNIVRNLMYVFGITTVVLAAATIYFRKKAPYILLRKETAAKPDNRQQMGGD